MNIISALSGAVQSGLRFVQRRPTAAAMLIAVGSVAGVAMDILPGSPAAVCTAIAAGRAVYKYRALVKGLDHWCEEKRGTPEYDRRLAASEQIKICYESNSDWLGLDVGLTSLPSVLGELTQLRRLSLCCNHITDMTPLISLTQLGELSLNPNHPNRIVFLTSPLANLTQLENVHVTSHSTTGSSPDLDLRRLRTLDLRYTDITGIPLPFPAESWVLTRGPFRSDHPSYMRPLMRESDFGLGFPGVGLQEANMIDAPLEERLTFWLNQRQKTFSRSEYEPLLNANLTDKKNLCVFLHKLKESKDFESAYTGANVALRVDQMLEFACQNKKFKKEMFSCVADGVTDCSDRTTVAFDRIEVQWLLHQEKTMSDRDLADLLIGVKRKYLLQGLAERVSEERNLPDPIETVLAYQLGLKETLGLPNSTKNMLFPSMSGVTPRMLDKAEKEILSQTSSVEQKTEILAQRSEWQERLRVHHTADFEKVEERILEELEELEKTPKRIKNFAENLSGDMQPEDREAAQAYLSGRANAVGRREELIRKLTREFLCSDSQAVNK